MSCSILLTYQGSSEALRWRTILQGDKTAFATLGIFFLWKKSGLELKRDECGELVYHLIKTNLED